MNEKWQQLKEWIGGSDNIVFFGGAGVSTESGIPDFRSVDGLYNQQYKYPPETIISHSFYMRYPEEFYRFCYGKPVCGDPGGHGIHRGIFCAGSQDSCIRAYECEKEHLPCNTLS